MNARTSAAALALLAALTLTGCAGTPDSSASETAAPQESVTPLAAEPDTKPSAEEVSADEQYLTDVRKALTNGRETSIPNASDEQLLLAGQQACEQLAAGTPDTQIHVVEGEQPDDLLGEFPESYIIATVVKGRIC